MLVVGYLTGKKLLLQEIFPNFVDLDVSFLQPAHIFVQKHHLSCPDLSGYVLAFPNEENSCSEAALGPA